MMIAGHNITLATRHEESTPQPPRRVLMIAAAFPPIGGPGVQRSAKFAKYLPAFGWHPFVWTMDEMKGLPNDPSLLEDLPPEVTRSTPSESVPCVELSPTWLDDHEAWARASLASLTQLIEGHDIQVIYSTFSPPSNHWLAWALKERTGLPWVADFRDLWIDDCRYAEPNRDRAALHRGFQQQVLETADVVVGVTPRQTDILAGHVPSQSAKFITITNGFDPADFEGIADSMEPDPSRFLLSHVGRFDQWRASDTLLQGLQRFSASLGPRFEFRLVGHVSQETLRRIKETGVRYSFVSYVPHGQAIREMCAADALLLPLPTGKNSESIIAAKLFEYLVARRPILVVGPPGGECENIVRLCEAGDSVPHDGTLIAEALGRMFYAWNKGQPMRGAERDRLRAYSRRELTRSLAGLFNRLTTRPRVVGVTTPTVSVIIPTFNRAALLSRALDSIVAQSYADWEIVLIDDGSTDETLQIAAHYADRLGDKFRHIRQGNQGSSAARNRGIESARGRFLAFLDSDDEFLPHKLERQMALFTLRPDLGLVYSDFSFLDLDGTRYERAIAAKWPLAREVPLEQVGTGLYVCGDRLFDVLIRGYFIATIVGMVRRDVLGSSIRFPVGMAYAEEWLFYLRVAKACRAGFVDEPLCLHHATAGSLARTDKVQNMVRYAQLLRAIEHSFADLTKSQRASLHEKLAMTLRQLGYETARDGRPLRAFGQFAKAVWHKPSFAVLGEAGRAAIRCLDFGRRASRASASHLKSAP